MSPAETSGSEVGSSGRIHSQTYNVNGRVFTVEVLPMRNGCFASFSEDNAPRMGAITLTIKSEKRSSSTSSLIPERKGSLFAGMVGELLAEKFGGIAVVSLYLREEIDPDIMKTLINEVRKLVAEDLNPAR